MPRTHKDPEIYAQVERVLSKISDHQTMTWDDLYEVALNWCEKNYDHHREAARNFDVLPMALILTALLYVEHPLLVRPGAGWIHPNLEIACVEIIHVELNRLDVHVPVRHSIHKPNLIDVD